MRRRIKSGELPAVLVAGRYRIRPEHADGLIRERTLTPTASQETAA